MSRLLRQWGHHATGMLTGVACVGLIASAHSGIGLGVRGLSERAAVDIAMDETTRAIGAAGQALPLSDEQRARIYDSVMRIPDAPIADVPAPELAEPLPPSVPLQDLPAGVTREIP